MTDRMNISSKYRIIVCRFSSCTLCCFVHKHRMRMVLRFVYAFAKWRTISIMHAETTEAQQPNPNRFSNVLATVQIRSAVHATCATIPRPQPSNGGIDTHILCG